MKKLAAVATLAFVVGFFSTKAERRAEAFPGAMCFDTAGCGSKCEVCVKESPTAPSGKCMKIAGCY